MWTQILERQEHLARNAGQLITSIAQTMEQLSMEQSRRKRAMVTQEEAVMETRHQTR